MAHLELMFKLLPPCIHSFSWLLKITLFSAFLNTLLVANNNITECSLYEI